MASEVWLPLSEQERQILRHALSVYIRSEAADRTEVNALVNKIVSTPPHPDVTIGVYGGQVQWTAGNPLPIRIVDYDGEKGDLPEADEDGHPCRMWFERSDEEREAQLKKPRLSLRSPPIAAAGDEIEITMIAQHLKLLANLLPHMMVVRVDAA
jgi:hypothetical protein